MMLVRKKWFLLKELESFPLCCRAGYSGYNSNTTILNAIICVMLFLTKYKHLTIL